jgi:hypothetical protein
MSPATVLALGFFLGIRHATDVDHVVAVSTIVARQRSLRGAVPIGALWGLGHTLTILLVGGAILLFGVVIPPRLGLSMEFSVALMLVLLGVLNVRSVIKDARSIARSQAATQAAGHEAHHHHSDAEHTHGSLDHGSHGHGSLDHGPLDHGSHGHGSQGHGPLGKLFGGLVHTHAEPSSAVTRGALRPLFIGIVHGLAGSAALALLVLGAIGDPWLGLVYLVVFGVGTIAGMVLITCALAVPFVVAAPRFASFQRVLAVSTGIASVALGSLLVYQIGFVDGGLFSAVPQWDPHGEH